MRTLLYRHVELEDQLRHEAQHKATGKLMAQKASSVLQSYHGPLLLLRVSHHTHENFCMAQITAHLHVGDAGETHTRVFQARAQQVAEFYRDQFTEHLLSMWI